MAKKTNKFKGPQPSAYDPTGVGEYLGLGRPLNFDQQNTKMCFIGAIAISVVATLIKVSQGMGSAEAVTYALGGALGFILCYMVALELDPDRSTGGLIGGVLTISAYQYFGEGNILVMLWLLFVLRMLNRTSGDRHRIGDNLIIIGSAGWMGHEGFWVYPMLTAGAYILETQIKGGYFRSYYLAGLALATLIFAEFSKQPNLISVEYIVLISVAFVLYLPQIRVGQYVQALGDKNKRRLYGNRLQGMAGFFLMIMFGATFLHGNGAGQQLLPAACAAIGVGLYMMKALVKKEIKFH